MIVGGYTLHLYCDDADHPCPKWEGSRTDVGEFSGNTVRAAEREARASGWRFFVEDGERKVRCPACIARSKR